jgi:hypothetical protein
LVKKEFGKKRRCEDCDAPFYDLGRPVTSCPKCRTPGIEELVKDYRIKRLCHFTRLENLYGIARDGIIPRSELQESDVVYFNDDERLDEFLTASSFSVSFPNYQLFYNFREQKFPNTKWAVIEVSPKLMWAQKSIFSPSNAASSASRQKTPKQRATSAAFQSMFTDFSCVKNGKPFTIRRQSLAIPPYYTTNPQAEVLVFGRVLPIFISRIVFPSLKELGWTKLNCQLPSHVQLDVEHSLFSYRNDYAAWKNIPTERTVDTEPLNDDIPF